MVATSNGEPREDPIFAFVDAVASTEIGIAMALLAFLTMISGALSGLLAASRFLFAMAKDCLLPDSLSETNERLAPHNGRLFSLVLRWEFVSYIAGQRCRN